jgi:hypothetical protein
VDMVNARRQLERVLGRRLAEVVALIGVLRHSRPRELVLDGRRCRLWLYFSGNCRYEPPGMAPACHRRRIDRRSSSTSPPIRHERRYRTRTAVRAPGSPVHRGGEHDLRGG